MKRLIVDDKILVELKRQYPKPSNAAEERLAKYISTVEMVVNEDFWLKLYSIPVNYLTHKGGQIGPRGGSIRLHKWLKDNKLEIVQEVGSKRQSSFQRNFTKVKINPSLARLENDWRPTDGKALFERQHPGFEKLTQQQIETNFDVVELDIQSLSNYIEQMKGDGCRDYKQKEEHALAQARAILALAQYKNGLFYQHKKKSDFGRTYYTGLSVQNVPKCLRPAMLGNSFEYDLRSAVVSWKMGFAHLYKFKKNQTVEDVFPRCYQFCTDKAPFYLEMRQEVFQGSFRSEERQLALLKEAMTALNFGCRLSDQTYLNSRGEKENQALLDIFTDSEERKRFLNCIAVKEFMAEQRKLDKIIRDWGVVEYSEILTLKNQKTGKELTKNGQMAFLFQHGETKVMNLVREFAKEKGLKVLANIHDAIIFRDKLTGTMKTELEKRLRDTTQNPYWAFGEKELKRVE